MTMPYTGIGGLGPPPPGMSTGSPMPSFGMPQHDPWKKKLTHAFATGGGPDMEPLMPPGGPAMIPGMPPHSPITGTSGYTPAGPQDTTFSGPMPSYGSDPNQLQVPPYKAYSPMGGMDTPFDPGTAGGAPTGFSAPPESPFGISAGGNGGGISPFGINAMEMLRRQQQQEMRY